MTLEEIFEANALTPKIVKLIQQDLFDIICLNNGIESLESKNIIVTDDSIFITEIPDTAPLSESDIIKGYGKLLLEAAATRRSIPSRLKRIADSCVKGEYTNLGELSLALEKRISDTIYIPLILLLGGLITLLIVLNQQGA